MDYYARRWANPFRNQGFEAYKGLFQYFEEEGAYVMHSTRDPAWYYDPWQQIVYGGLLLYLMGPLLVQFMSPVAIMTTAGLLAAPAWVVRAIEFRKEEKRLNVSCDSLPHQGPLFELSGVAAQINSVYRVRSGIVLGEVVYTTFLRRSQRLALFIIVAVVLPVLRIGLGWAINELAIFAGAAASVAVLTAIMNRIRLRVNDDGVLVESVSGFTVVGSAKLPFQDMCANIDLAPDQA